MTNPKNPALQLVSDTTEQINRAVFGAGLSTSGAAGQGSSSSDPSPGQQSEGRAVQSIGQTTAIVIQDAGDMLRNINAVEITAIGAATAAWIATQEPSYGDIVTASMATMQTAAALYLTIGTNAFTVLSQFSAAPAAAAKPPAALRTRVKGGEHARR